MNEFVYVSIDLVLLVIGLQFTRGKLLGFVLGLDQEQKDPETLAKYLGWLMVGATLLVSVTTILYIVTGTPNMEQLTWNAHVFYYPVAIAAGGFVIHIFANRK